MAVLGLDTLGQSLRERGVRGEGARVALTAVARLLGALRLTRYIRVVVPGIAEVVARRTIEYPFGGASMRE